MVCMVGGVHGRGACVPGAHAWQGVCMAGGACMAGCMHGRGGEHGRGRGHAWHTVNERAVRILLECILVYLKFRPELMCDHS